MKDMPTLQELSAEQQDVVEMDLEGRYLVTGPPGTGKTVLAMYRCQHLARLASEVLLITFTKQLTGYMEAAVDTDSMEELDNETIVMRTFHSWFYRYFLRTFGRRVPERAAYSPDMPEVIRIMEEHMDDADTNQALVIDEAQDFEKEIFLFMKHIIANVTVFADENQRITETNSDLTEIRNNLLPETVLNLTKNYRNTAGVARLAGCFYTDTTTGLPQLPDRRGEKPRLLHTRNVKEATEWILNLRENNRDVSIGVLVKNRRILNRFLSEFGFGEDSRRARSRRRSVEYYASTDRFGEAGIQWDRPGIKCLMYASAKGLEFDYVVLPELQKTESSPENLEARMMMFMLCSRPRDELIMMYSGRGEPGILEDVPPDLYEKVSA